MKALWPACQSVSMQISPAVAWRCKKATAYPTHLAPSLVSQATSLTSAESKLTQHMCSSYQAQLASATGIPLGQYMWHL